MEFTLTLVLHLVYQHLSNFPNALLVVPNDEEWKTSWRGLLAQGRLFGPQQKPLNKVPFRFQYCFTCDDSRCKGHTMMIEDWELGQLYFNELTHLGSPGAAAASVRRKFLEELCGAGKDTHFFVGTTLRFGSWVVLGVFWPPKLDSQNTQKQLQLFS